MQSGIKINSTMYIVTPRMTHSLAHGDGRGSNKRMRWDHLVTKPWLQEVRICWQCKSPRNTAATLTPFAVRTLPARSCCAVCGAAATCKTVANSRKTGSVARPARLPGLGCKAALQRDAGALNPSTCKLENRAIVSDLTEISVRTCVDINSINICECDSL